MSRLEELFRSRKKKALLMPYITGGYPTIHECRHVLDAFVAGGADMIELGVPFSDPLADGPVVQASAQRALDEGVTPDDVLALAAFTLLSETEGIIPALESSHAIAYVVKHAGRFSPGDAIIVNLSGRGDKDVHQAARALGLLE